MFMSHVLPVVAPRSSIGWGLRLASILGAFWALTIALQTSWSVSGGAGILSSLMFALWACSKWLDTHEKLENLSLYDLATGVFNRRSFCERLTKALPQSGVLLALDLDHFKSVNGRWGHEVGDICLMALAQRCREVTRDSDIIGRLDGATFAIYLPGAPLEVGKNIAQRLSEGIQVTTGAGNLNLTVSVGAVIANGRMSVESLLRRADQALERAKLQGRARVIVREQPLAA